MPTVLLVQHFFFYERQETTSSSLRGDRRGLDAGFGARVPEDAHGKDNDARLPALVARASYVFFIGDAMSIFYITIGGEH